jgi:DNA-binding transcriptional ArsR family regulator
MTVAATAAVVASASTLAALAEAAGWSGWTPWLLPAALDIGGSVGGWCWLRPGAPAAARAFGRAVALVGAVGTLLGNAAGHLIVSGYAQAGPELVVIVGAVPAAVLVALAHLAALLTDDRYPIAAKSRAKRTPPVRPTVLEPASSGEPARNGPAVADGDAVPDTDTRAVVLAQLRNRPATIAELVRATGRSRSTIVGHLGALADSGAVVRDEAKRYRCPTLTPAGGQS